MKPTAFAERMGRLVDKLAKLKLRVKLHAKIGEELRVEMEDEELVLDPKLQDKAFDIAANEVSDRMATMFAKELAKQIRAVIEQDSDDDEARGRHGDQANDEEGAAQARRRRRRREAERRLGRAGGAGNNGVDDDGKGIDDNRDGENGGDSRGGGESNADQNAPEKEPFRLLQPRTAKEIYEHLQSFLNKNLGPFEIDDDMVHRLSKKVEIEGRRIQRELDLSEEEVMWLATMSLYDIVILCDDSGSMKQGQRIPALLKTLQSVTAWATRLEPNGVSVRFLNFAKDMNEEYDNITSGDKLADVVYKVGQNLGRQTKLGTALEEKVLKHRVEKRDKPLIAPIGETKTCLRNCIISYKNKLGEAGSKAGLVFIIFQVGKSRKAQEFLNSLSEDAELEGLMHRSNQPVDAVMSSLEDRLDVVESDTGREYKKYVRT
ncbi:hypothetical protein CEP53_000454 [Fusarium sp. AF-6]|nr:hypothetical protein CEP53_000454 [Fusarium sp. AF-6]